MSGLALWPNAGANTRALFIRLACDGDVRLVDRGNSRADAVRYLTIKQALEVLEGGPKETS